MFVDRILLLADTIEQLEDGTAGGTFNMRSYQHGCGTPACIGGWAVELFAPEDIRDLQPCEIPEIAGRELGFQFQEERRGELEGDLFAPDGTGASWCVGDHDPLHVSARRAAAQLRHLACTGEVDWDATPSIERTTYT